jgi:putative heme iron utilization protein
VHYFKFLVRYYINEKDLLNASKAYQTIYDTFNKAQSDEALIATIDPTGNERKSSF